MIQLWWGVRSALFVTWMALTLVPWALCALLLLRHFTRAHGVTAADLLLVYWTLKLPTLGHTLTALAQRATVVATGGHGDGVGHRAHQHWCTAWGGAAIAELATKVVAPALHPAIAQRSAVVRCTGGNVHGGVEAGHADRFR